MKDNDDYEIISLLHILIALVVGITLSLAAIVVVIFEAETLPLGMTISVISVAVVVLIILTPFTIKQYKTLITLIKNLFDK
jgi:hypothetical protein